MPVKMSLRFNKRELKAIKGSNIKRGLSSATRKASSTSLRDMRSKASKQVRARKRLKAKVVRAAIKPRKNKARAIEDMAWGVDVRGDTVRLTDYPHRPTKKGVSVTINRGKLTKIKSAFVATMKSGHTGIFVRKTMKSKPMIHLLGSRPVDALLHKGEADEVAQKGRAAFFATLLRLLRAELDKAG